MSREPLVVLISDTEDPAAVDTLAHLAPVADRLRIRCVTSTAELSAQPPISLVVSRRVLDHPIVRGHPTLTMAQVCELDTASLVEMAQELQDAEATASKPPTPTTSGGSHDPKLWDALTMQTLPSAATSHHESADTDNTPDQGDDQAVASSALHGTTLVERDPNRQRSVRIENELPLPLANLATTNRGCRLVPVIGTDECLSAQVACMLSQILAEAGPTTLIELDPAGLQRFLHDAPLETPSFVDLVHRAGSIPWSELAMVVPSRGYRLIPSPPPFAPKLGANPEVIERLLSNFAESAATLVTTLSSSMLRDRNSTQGGFRDDDVLAESLLAQSTMVVFAAGGGLIPTFELVNLVRKVIQHMPAIQEILIAVESPRSEFKGGKNLQQLLSEAIPESIARLTNLEIVTLGTLTLDDYHEAVLAFPANVLRPLRSFAKRVWNQPCLEPVVYAQSLNYPFYERTDPLLEFFREYQG